MRASNALDWCATTRQLLHGRRFTTIQLSVVAFAVCLDYCADLVDGFTRKYKDGTVTSVPGDTIARADVPLDPRRIRSLRDRAHALRDGVLHLGDRADAGGEINVDMKAGPPRTVTISVTDTRGQRAKKVSLERTEIESALDKLEPWLETHRKRLNS